MTKIKKTFLVILITILILLLINYGAHFLVTKSPTLPSPVKIYYSKQYFGLGSRKIKIYSNGDVFEDYEMEEPNHKEKYKYKKTLSKKELSILKEQITNFDGNNNNPDLQKFVNKLIYGCEEFNITGSC